ncbi:hypothetical protein, partial [Bifidobacterium catenulatum]|uniref:hypothetical protein n=1 Tax=Bifidobacterium catenulatum TaxID=1686 RepID=UPI0011846A4C
MAKALIRDRWLKSKAVVDGVELTPTTGMKRQVAANPDTADVPAALWTADYGRGMRWQVCWRADGRQWLADGEVNVMPHGRPPV